MRLVNLLLGLAAWAFVIWMLFPVVGAAVGGIGKLLRGGV